MDYIIKDKTFLESIMDTEFYAIDDSDMGIFYNGMYLHYTINCIFTFKII